MQILRDGFGEETKARTFWRFVEDSSGVTVFDRDGHSERCDLLVGADGMRTRIGAQLFGELPLRELGVRVAFGDCSTAEFTGPWAHLLGSDGPLGAGKAYSAQGQGQSFWSVTTHGHGTGTPSVYWMVFTRTPGMTTRDALRKDFETAPPGVNWMISKTNPEDFIGPTIVYDRRPLRRWSNGRVVLAATAAHPMVPDTGQGLNQSLEDAVTLAHNLQTSGSVAGALAAFQRARVARVAMAVEQSRVLSRVTTANNGWVANARDALAPSFAPEAAKRSLDILVNHNVPVLIPA